MDGDRFSDFDSEQILWTFKRACIRAARLLEDPWRVRDVRVHGQPWSHPAEDLAGLFGSRMMGYYSLGECRIRRTCPEADGVCGLVDQHIDTL